MIKTLSRSEPLSALKLLKIILTKLGLGPYQSKEPFFLKRRRKKKWVENYRVHKLGLLTTYSMIFNIQLCRTRYV